MNERTATGVGSLVVRDAAEADMEAVARIYAHHVERGLATFEEAAPTDEEMRARRLKVLAVGAPYLVAEIDGEIVGYCYAAPYHARPAYRHTLEDSVYVAPGRGGRGIGGALLAELIARCEAGPWRWMVAIIGDSGNSASIALHRRYGFEPVGTLRSVGFKHGRWVDTPIMQRVLGPGDSRPPDDLTATPAR
ncbi:MAG: N-acetyltransferase family protein [Roseiarcus sp.]|uniref:GNAT family N-acetyltransferase n=1 Tax=Roseiarcus sp. TaxID=1969460 RepID=UPI003C27C0B4